MLTSFLGLLEIQKKRIKGSTITVIPHYQPNFHSDDKDFCRASQSRWEVRVFQTSWFVNGWCSNFENTNNQTLASGVCCRGVGGVRSWELICALVFLNFHFDIIDKNKIPKLPRNCCLQRSLQDEIVKTSRVDIIKYSLFNAKHSSHLWFWESLMFSSFVKKIYFFQISHFYV